MAAGKQFTKAGTGLLVKHSVVNQSSNFSRAGGEIWKKTFMSEQFTEVNNGLLVRAPGKINLSLLVKGKRPDGYHELETIMAKIDWYDEILIENNERNPKSESRRFEHGGKMSTETNMS